MTDERIRALIQKFNVHGERRPMLAAKRVAKLGRKAVPALLDALKNSPNIPIRRWSAYALRFIADPRVVSPLRKALKDPNMSVRLLAMESLEVVDGSRAGKFIVPLLKDESGGVRVRTIGCLARLKFKPALKPLKTLLRDEKDYVRKAAAETIRAHLVNGNCRVASPELS